MNTPCRFASCHWTRRMVTAIVAFAVSGVAVVSWGQEKKKSPDAASVFEFVPSPRSTYFLTIVGTDETEKTAAALMFSPSGPAIGYVCDGEKVSVWFRGSLAEDETQLELRNDRGDTLSADWSSEGAVKGEATISGAPIRFSLDLGDATSLLREDKVVKGQRQTSGWITTNTGTVYGATVGAVPPGSVPSVAGERRRITPEAAPAKTPEEEAAEALDPDDGASKRVLCKLIIGQILDIQKRQKLGKATEEDLQKLKRLRKTGKDAGCPNIPKPVSTPPAATGGTKPPKVKSDSTAVSLGLRG